MMKRYIGALLKRFDKAGFLKRINFKLTYKAGNKKFTLPVIHGIGYQLYVTSEKWATELYEKLLKINPGTFVDVGANNGQTLLKIASFSDELSYVGFEPNPSCFYYLKKLVDANKLSGCNIFPVGLHYENKIVTLISDNDFASGASILPNFREDNSRYKIKQNVPVMNGDEIFEKLNNNIAVIKADVEGAELEVIKGLQKTIAKYNPFVVLEILPVYNNTRENGRYRIERQNELLSILKILGYQMYRIDETNGNLLALTEIEIHNKMSKTNYLFAPLQQVGAVANNFTIV